jgi:hypothetical protein
MSAILEFSFREIAPQRQAVLERLGIPGGIEPPGHIGELYLAATELLAESAVPQGVLTEVAVEEFAVIFEGEGHNARRSPVGDIYPRADHLALFATTLGEATSRAIAHGFETRDFALASMLDAAASETADALAEQTERRYESMLRERGWQQQDGGVLRYSPGYCGWDVSGQRRLFARLDPGRIGITLNESALMQPLKSVSGVIIAAPREAHEFAPTFDFCAACETFECRERLRALRAR